MKDLIEAVKKLTKKVQDGSATLEEIDNYRYLVCKLNILTQASGTESLLKLEKTHLIAMVDTVATMLFPNDWDSKPSLVEIKQDEAT